MSERSLRSFDSLADRLRLHLQSATRAVLIVEGIKDRLILGELMPEREFFPAGTRSAVLDAVSQLHSLGQCLFVAVYDRDFDHPPPPYGSGVDAHLLPYDERDLEGMLIDLGGLARLLLYKGSQDKLEARGGAGPFVQELAQVILPVTRLRAANAADAMGLPFDEVPLEGKIQQKDLILPILPYCSALAGASQGSVGAAQLIDIASTSDISLAPRGKDVVAVASVALRSRVGSLPKAASDPTLLAADLLSTSQMLLHESAWFGRLADLLVAADERRLDCA